MLVTRQTMAEQISQAAMVFQENSTGYPPKAVSVVLNKDTLVITLHGALTPAEQAMAIDPTGAAKVQEFHRQLFASSSEALRKEIKRITGVEVRDAMAEVDNQKCATIHVFKGGTMVQVFLLAGSVPDEKWSGLEGEAPTATKGPG